MRIRLDRMGNKQSKTVSGSEECYLIVVLSVIPRAGNASKPEPDKSKESEHRYTNTGMNKT